jgi:hypothetical protein
MITIDIFSEKNVFITFWGRTMPANAIERKVKTTLAQPKTNLLFKMQK